MTLVVLALCGLIVRGSLSCCRPIGESRCRLQAARRAQARSWCRPCTASARSNRWRLMRGSGTCGMSMVARVAKARLAEGMTANLIQAVVRPLERLAVSGVFALGVYLALIDQGSGLYRRACSPS